MKQDASQFDRYYKLAELITALLNGSISDQSGAELDQWLATDKEARQYYLEYINTHVGLRKISGAFLQENVKPAEPEVGANDLLPDFLNDVYTQELEVVERREQAARQQVKEHDLNLSKETNKYQRSRISKYSVFHVTGAVAALAAFAFLLLLLEKASQIKYQTSPSAPIVATVKKQIGAHCSTDDGLVESGDKIHQGKMTLDGGLAHLVFEYGAEVIIQGPAEVYLESNNEMVLIQGQISANVPASASGFAVNTSDAKIVDLGTEFGVACLEGRETEVHVFDGRVSLATKKYDPITKSKVDKTIELTEGNAIQISRDHTFKTITFDNHRFVKKEGFLQRIRARDGSGYDRWLLYRDKIRRDPALAAYYTFEKDDSRPDVLVNYAEQTLDRCNGQLGENNIPATKPTWAEGRWRQKTALQFNRSQKQLVIVPGEEDLYINGPITISLWIKCPDQVAGGQLFGCRSNDVMNYQLTFILWNSNQDALHFYRYKRDSKQGPARSKEISPDRNWQHIVVTHDNETLQFFINGKLFNSRDYKSLHNPIPAELLIGAARNYQSDMSRNMFNGIMDELMIFERVLTSAEIQEMYEKGKP